MYSSLQHSFRSFFTALLCVSAGSWGKEQGRCRGQQSTAERWDSKANTALWTLPPPLQACSRRCAPSLCGQESHLQLCCSTVHRCRAGPLHPGLVGSLVHSGRWVSKCGDPCGVFGSPNYDWVAIWIQKPSSTPQLEYWTRTIAITMIIRFLLRFTECSLMLHHKKIQNPNPDTRPS